MSLCYTRKFPITELTENFKSTVEFCFVCAMITGLPSHRVPKVVVVCFISSSHLAVVKWLPNPSVVPV